jgi:hypothetical protein
MSVEFLSCLMAINHTERFERHKAIIQEIAANPAVLTVVDECATGSGYWVYLKPGYVWDGTTTHVHESTPSRCRRALAFVTFDPIAWGHACGASAAQVAEVQRLRDSEVTELREVKNAEGFHVPTALSRQGVIEFSDSFSLCGAAACLDAAGFTLSPKVAALSRRWADLGQKPNPEGVAMAREILGA